MRFKHNFKLLGGAVARPDPDYFWWRSQQKTFLAEIGIFGDDRGPMQPGILPDQMIGAEVKSTSRTWTDSGNSSARIAASLQDRF